MNFKKIYGLILGVIAAGLTSCSSDLNNEEKAPVSPNETAKRTLSISTGDAKTRSEVKIDADPGQMSETPSQKKININK